MNPLLLIGGVCIILGLIQLSKDVEETENLPLPAPKKKKKKAPVSPVSVVVQSPGQSGIIPQGETAKVPPGTPTNTPTEE
jgi:hypothetical protein